MRVVLAATGASGTIYLQRLLDRLSGPEHELHLVLTAYAKQVVQEETGGLRLPPNVTEHSDKSMNAPFASGSAVFDAMVVCPCSMGTLGRIAAGTSETLTLRAADVFLKERRKLVLVPRETPWSLIHARNALAVIEAGAVLLPAMPSFYSRPKSFDELADTVVWRILDQIGIPSPDACRWREPSPDSGHYSERCRAQGERASRPLRGWKPDRSNVPHTGETAMPPENNRESASFGDAPPDSK